MLLGWGTLLYEWIAVDQSSDPHASIPVLPAILLGIVGCVGFWFMIAPLLRLPPFRATAKAEPPEPTRTPPRADPWTEAEVEIKYALHKQLADEYKAAAGVSIAAAAVNVGEPTPTGPDIAAFDFYTEPQRIDDGWVVHGRKALDNVALWVHVRNDGPTTNFFARVTNVRGIDHPTAGKDIWQSEDGTHYRIPQPAWEHTDESRVEIDGYGGERKLRLANLSRIPHRMVWFWTVERGPRAMGNQYIIGELGITGTVTITFDVTVVARRAGTDYPKTKHAVLTIPDTGTQLHGELPTFGWVTP